MSNNNNTCNVCNTPLGNHKNLCLFCDGEWCSETCWKKHPCEQVTVGGEV